MFLHSGQDRYIVQSFQLLNSQNEVEGQKKASLYKKINEFIKERLFIETYDKQYTGAHNFTGYFIKKQRSNVLCFQLCML